MSSKILVGHLQEFLTKSKGFDKVLQSVKLLSASNGNIVAEMKVEEEHSNPLGGLHGGLSATLVDSLSSYALLTHEKGSDPSVSVDIHLTYSKGAKIGDEILIESNTIRVGRSLAFLEVFIRDKISRELLVQATHTKYFLRPKK